MMAQGSSEKPNTLVKDPCLLCGQEFHQSKTNKHRLFNGYKSKSKAEFTVVLEGFVGRKFRDTTLAICTSCRTLIMRYDRVSKDAERIKMLVDDMWKKNREKRCAASTPKLEVKRQRKLIDTTTTYDEACNIASNSLQATEGDISAAKENLKTGLKPLQERLRILEELKRTLHETAEHIVFQTQHIEKQIKEEFVQLRKMLSKEEATRIKALREEEEQKSLMMKEKIERMGREISSLTITIKTIEEEMRAEDALFLQNYETTMKRTQCVLPDSENISGLLINVPKHLSNLRFNLLHKMQEKVEFTPVILDPNSAHCNLILSADLTSVRYSDEERIVPDNPERFDMFACVLGSDAFDSGSHCWDVEVGDSTGWFLGVMTESAHRRNKIFSRSGIWLVGHFCGEYKAHIPPQSPTLLPVKDKLQRVKVQLDWDSGKLSFSDPLTNTHIHSFTHRFTERLLPFFGIGCDISPLQILPVKSSGKTIS
ncbi:E3 ubiquitin-protein ligase TRIM35 [Misgurnus anguillicaudatus]|uniref:E3 ubiquitin-protein ligase TRIM35 n=1 Tax=Misgurnus anguillicaudatus TaxID=75329 RepID=UPI003CCF91EB